MTYYFKINSVNKIVKFLQTFQWIVTGHLCGGENRKSEKDRIRKGVNVLIGTPGRLLDHILHTTSMKLDKVRCLVLDEADRLLDMGFRKDIIALVEELDKYKTNTGYDPMGMLKKSIKFDDDDDVDEEVVEKEISNLGLPPLKDVHGKNRQTILLSATLTKEVQELAQFAMKDHVYIDALNEDITGNTFVIPKNVKQEFILTYVKHRLFTLSALIIAKSKQNNKLFVFMASTQMVDYHYELFANYLVKMPKNRGKLKVGNIVLLDGDSALSDEEDEEEVVLDTQFFKLHGNMDQKERKDVFNKFRTATKGVLICTVSDFLKRLKIRKVDNFILFRMWLHEESTYQRPIVLYNIRHRKRMRIICIGSDGQGEPENMDRL